jgi:radical SAM protein with 4Fe4S-binding SPASM domain
VLLQASLEFTERCNLHCVHCYTNQPTSDPNIRKQELTLAEWQNILDQMADTGILWILVTGGEPLVRPDFAEFYTYAKRKGFHVTLFTNGTLLTPELADLLAEYPPWQIEITLYGATAETYEKVTGVPGSYRRCRQAIEMLVARDLTLNLKTMALTINVHEISAMQHMAETWGTRFRYDPMIHSRLDNGSVNPLSYRLSPEEIIALEQKDVGRLQKWQDFCSQPWLPPDQERLFMCGAGSKTCHINPYGGLHPCLMVKWIEYNLQQNSFQDAWHKSLSEVSAMRVTRDWTCRECELRILCGNCPGWAHLETNNAESPEMFRCRLAHLRHQRLGLAVRIVDNKTINHL